MVSRSAALVVTAVLAASAACSGSGESGEVGRKDLGEAWPLTVDGGTLRCEPYAAGALAVIFEADDGSEYGVNGAAKSRDYADITPIWADDPGLGSGLKKNIGPLIDRGLELCD